MSGQVELIYPTLSSGDEWDGESSLALVLQGNTVGGGATRLHLNLLSITMDTVPTLHHLTA